MPGVRLLLVQLGIDANAGNLFENRQSVGTIKPLSVFGILASILF